MFTCDREGRQNLTQVAAITVGWQSEVANKEDGIIFGETKGTWCEFCDINFVRWNVTYMWTVYGFTLIDHLTMV